MPEHFWNNENFSKFFGNVRHKQFERKRDIPLASINWFCCQIFFETSKSFQWKFSMMSDKKIDAKSWYSPLSTKSFYPHQSFFKTPNCSHWVVPVMRDKKTFDEKSDNPSESMKSFRCKNFFLKNERFLLNFFWYCETKKFSLEKRDIPLASKKCFRYQKFSETTESSQWTFSISWDKNKFNGNLRYPSACPYVSSHSRVFLKPRWVSNESFRWSETKKYRRKNVMFTSLSHKLFSPPKFFWNAELFPLNSFSIMRQNNVWRERWYLQRIQKSFRCKKTFLK